MTLNFGRGNGPAEIVIDYEKCTSCGLCVKVCRGAPIYMKDRKVSVDQSILFGCIGCGQCMALCPTQAIKIIGRDLSPEDIFQLSPINDQTFSEDFIHLLESRRSVRDFQDREVDSKLIEKILASAATAPMGIPPSEVGVVVLSGRTKVQEFRQALTDSIKRIQPFFTPLSLALMRLVMSKEDHQAMKQFVGPALNFYLQDIENNRDWFLYDAPLAMCFYANAFADPGDVYVAATQAMIAGVALGLGTCMLGFPMYFVHYDKRIRRQFQFPEKVRSGLVVIFGYPAVKYHQGIKRRFADVKILSS
jgi:nitroreductase/NAD-dependent dihydropyrimidine dehydrogenase PreA subunit